jgi:hypothetical protein
VPSSRRPITQAPTPFRVNIWGARRRLTVEFLSSLLTLFSGCARRTCSNLSQIALLPYLEAQPSFHPASCTITLFFHFLLLHVLISPCERACCLVVFSTFCLKIPHPAPARRRGASNHLLKDVCAVHGRCRWHCPCCVCAYLQARSRLFINPQRERSTVCRSRTIYGLHLRPRVY